MRFHIRRLVVFALCSTFAVTIILNVLRSSDLELALPPQHFEVERRPQRPQSLDERLAKYDPGRRGNASEQAILDPDPSLFVDSQRRPLPLAQSKKADTKQEIEDIIEDELMSESVPGSENEHTRRQYVHLPVKGNIGVETLWWSSNPDDYPDDRIQAQMNHIPRNYHRTDAKIKTIYMPGGLGNEPEGQEKFVVEQCPVNSCRLSSDRTVALTAEMRLLQSDAVFYFTKKPPGQIWIMFLLESPANTGEYPHARDLINWTATFRWDSTLVTPYEKFVPYHNASYLQERLTKRRRRQTPSLGSELKTTRRNYAAGKTKMVAWFVSNCGPKNKRNKYASELAKYAPLPFFLHRVSKKIGALRFFGIPF